MLQEDVIDHFPHEVTAMSAGTCGKNLQQRAVDLPTVVRPAHHELIVGKHYGHGNPHQQHPQPWPPLLPHAHEHAEGYNTKCGEQRISDNLVYPARKETQKDSDQVRDNSGGSGRPGERNFLMLRDARCDINLP